jgi:malate synthase
MVDVSNAAVLEAMKALRHEMAGVRRELSDIRDALQDAIEMAYDDGFEDACEDMSGLDDEMDTDVDEDEHPAWKRRRDDFGR